MFKHALTHDVAYESVLAERRRGLHRTIGLAIEELYADRLAELYETLAHHFEPRRGVGARARTTTSAPRRRRPTTSPTAPSSRTAGRRSRSPTASATACRPTRRRQRSRSASALACFYVSEFARLRRRVRARPRRAAAEPERARACDLAHAALSALLGARATTRARRDERRGARHSARRTDRAPAEALASERCRAGRSASATATWTAGSGVSTRGARRRARRRATRRRVALIRFQLAMLAEWTRRLPARDRAQRAGASPPGGASGWRTSSSGRPGSSARRTAASATTARAHRPADRGARRLRPHRRPRLEEPPAEHARLVLRRDREPDARARVQRARRRRSRARSATRRSSPTPRSTSPATTSRSATSTARARYLEPDPSSARARPGDPWMRWRYALHATDVLGRIVLAEPRPSVPSPWPTRRKPPSHAITSPRSASVPRCCAAPRSWLSSATTRRSRRSPGRLRGADRIGYPRAAWQALGLLAELKRRAGKLTEADAYATRQRALVERLALSLREPELRQQLIAVATASRTDR